MHPIIYENSKFYLKNINKSQQGVVYKYNPRLSVQGNLFEMNITMSEKMEFNDEWQAFPYYILADAGRSYVQGQPRMAPELIQKYKAAPNFTAQQFIRQDISNIDIAHQYYGSNGNKVGGTAIDSKWNFNLGHCISWRIVAILRDLDSQIQSGKITVSFDIGRQIFDDKYLLLYDADCFDFVLLQFQTQQTLSDYWNNQLAGKPALPTPNFEQLFLNCKIQQLYYKISLKSLARINIKQMSANDYRYSLILHDMYSAFSKAFCVNIQKIENNIIEVIDPNLWECHETKRDHTTTLGYIVFIRRSVLDGYTIQNTTIRNSIQDNINSSNSQKGVDIMKIYYQWQYAGMSAYGPDSNEFNNLRLYTLNIGASIQLLQRQNRFKQDTYESGKNRNGSAIQAIVEYVQQQSQQVIVEKRVRFQYALSLKELNLRYASLNPSNVVISIPKFNHDLEHFLINGITKYSLASNYSGICSFLASLAILVRLGAVNQKAYELFITMNHIHDSQIGQNDECVIQQIFGKYNVPGGNSDVNILRLLNLPISSDKKQIKIYNVSYFGYQNAALERLAMRYNANNPFVHYTYAAILCMYCASCECHFYFEVAIEFGTKIQLNCIECQGPLAVEQTKSKYICPDYAICYNAQSSADILQIGDDPNYYSILSAQFDIPAHAVSFHKYGNFVFVQDNSSITTLQKWLTTTNGQQSHIPNHTVLNDVDFNNMLMKHNASAKTIMILGKKTEMADYKNTLNDKLMKFLISNCTKFMPIGPDILAADGKCINFKKQTITQKQIQDIHLAQPSFNDFVRVTGGVHKKPTISYQHITALIFALLLFLFYVVSQSDNTPAPLINQMAPYDIC